MEEKELQDNKNKKKKALITIIIIIMIIIIIVSILFVKKDVLYNSIFRADIEENQYIEYNNNELQRFVNYISPIDSFGPSEKLYNEKNLNADDLSPREKIEYIGYAVYDKHTTSPDGVYDILSEEDIRSLVETVYGPGTYQRTDFNLGCNTYLYNNGYYYAKTGCGGESAYSVVNKAISYKSTKEKLEITTAYVFFHVRAKKIYKDYEKTILLDKFSMDTDSDPNRYIKEYINDNKEKLNHIVYTYESTDGKNYYFKKFTNRITK